MNKFLLYMLALLSGLIATTSGVALAETTLISKEIKALFSGKTVSAHNAKNGYDATYYYSPDGSIRGVRDGEPMSGEWAVIGVDQLCIKEGMKNPCRSIIENNGIYKRVKVKRNGDQETMSTYKSFTDGNINNY
jgi:hypothetical protein